MPSNSNQKAFHNLSLPSHPYHNPPPPTPTTMPSKLRRAIGAVKDQTSIGLAVVTGSSDLEVAVLKATTHDDVPTEDRHANEVLILASSSPSSAASLVQALSRRISRTRSWVVALKSLALAHRTLRDGGPHFPREAYAASRRGPRLFDLSAFRDESTRSSPWDYTSFVRTLALYLDSRLDSFILGKLHRRHATSSVPNMKPPMILERIGHWQRLLDRAIGTRPTGPAKNHRIIKIALYAVIRESFDLYRDISDGLSMLLDNFFHLPYSASGQTFQSCVRAAKQFEQLEAFYADCKSIGVGRTSEYPSVQKISAVLLGTLQDFLNENKPAATSPTTNLLTWRTSDDVSSEASRVTQPLSDWESVASDQNWPTVPARFHDHKESPSSTLDGWELVLVETAAKSATSSAAPERSISYRIPHNYNNPFLHDINDKSLGVVPSAPLTAPHPAFRAALPALRQPTFRPPVQRQENLQTSSLQVAVSNLERKLKPIDGRPSSSLANPPTFEAKPIDWRPSPSLANPPTFEAKPIDWRPSPSLANLPTFEAKPIDWRPSPSLSNRPTFEAKFDDGTATTLPSPTFRAAKRTLSPTFRSAAAMPLPTFRAVGTDGDAAQKERDPFVETLRVPASLAAETALVERSDQLRREQLIREQQMWMQQQSKIIAKNMGF